MHGDGRVTFVSILALPPPADAGPVVAGNGSVRMFANVPSAWTQLTRPRNELIGLDPALAPAARTSPTTLISRCPVGDSSPLAEVSVHASPPPGMPRSGTSDWVPVRLAGTPTIEWNSRIGAPRPAVTTCAPSSNVSATAPPSAILVRVRS